MVPQQNKKWLLPGTVLFVALVIVGGDLYAWRYLGWPDIYATLVMNGMVAMGTLILAVVAWIENKNTIRQMQIDRAKPGILSLITYWIDALDKSLKDHQDLFPEKDGKHIHFARFYPITDPFGNAPFGESELPDQIVHEIGKEYQLLPEDLRAYDRTAEEYQTARWDLKSALEEYFKNEFIDYLDSRQVHDDIKQYLDDKGIDNPSPEDYLVDNLNSFVYTVFTGEADSKPYTEGYWEHVPESPIKVRNKPQFADAFSDLKTHHKKLRKLNNRMVTRLEKARKELKYRYNIIEPEVVELKSGRYDY